nr:hypothetical protein [Tanacetum cinerariifolium]
EDEHVLLAEEQPLPPVVSPTTESPEYVAESDPKEDPKEYEDDETEHGPVDYLMDRGDDGDDDDGDSSRDDADDKDEDKENEEEEEHLALADSAIVILTDELVSPPEGTKHVTLPPFTDATTTRARISIRLQAAISFLPEAERVDLLMEDRIAHQETIQIMEEEAYVAREAWAHSIGLSQAVYSELQTHQKQVYAHEFQLQTQL